MTRAALFALLSHWRRAPLQLAIVVIGLALATGLWTGVQAINSEARASYARAEATLNQANFARLVAPDGAMVSPQTFVDLRRAGWIVSPVVDTSFRVGDRRLRLIGIDPFTAPPGSSPTALADGTTFGDFLSGDVLFAAQDVEWPGARLSRSDELASGTVIGDLTAIWDVLGEEVLTHLLVLPGQPANLPPASDFGLLEESPTGATDAARLTDSFHLNLTAFGLLSFGVGLFIVQAAIGLAFEQRRAMIRTLRALGVPLGRLITLLAAETLIIALIAGSLGVVLGYVLAAALLPDVAATLRGLYGAQVGNALRLDPTWILGGFAVALLGAVAAAGQSLWQLAKMPLLAPARPRAWAMASARRFALLAGLGMVLLVAAGLTFAFGSGLVLGFLGLAALLVGAALLLPILVVGAMRVAANLSRGVVLQWVWADTRQQVPGLSLALMALLLALAANVGVGTMVQSFRLTFTGWLDQRLAAELYITAENDARGDAAVVFLEPMTDAILPIRATEIPVLGREIEVFGIRDHATYRDHWPLIVAQDNVWDAVALGEAVLINEQMFRRESLGLGDTLRLGDLGALPIAGVYSDYGNPEGQAIVSLGRLEAVFPDLSRTRYALRMDPETRAMVRDALIQDFGLPPGNIIDQAGIKSFSLNVFDRTFVISGALNVLTLGVASFALLASLLTLSTMRLPQMAPVWAMGLTRRRLALIEVGRAVALAAVIWVLAIPVGLALAWVLLAIVNVEAFGWRLPMHVFPSQWVSLGLWAGAAALIAAALPAWRLARIAPARLVAVFAHER